MSCFYFDIESLSIFSIGHSHWTFKSTCATCKLKICNCLIESYKKIKIHRRRHHHHHHRRRCRRFHLPVFGCSPCWWLCSSVLCSLPSGPLDGPLWSSVCPQAAGSGQGVPLGDKSSDVRPGTPRGTAEVGDVIGDPIDKNWIF